LKFGKKTSQKKDKCLEIGLHKNQLTFYKSDSRYTVYSGGIGSGKTFVGAFWAISMILAYPKSKGVITANTHSQLRKSTLPLVFEILDKFGIKYRYLANQGLLKVGNVDVYCSSMENYDNIRGINAGWAWSDECAFYDEAAFLVLIGRIRDKKAPCQWKGTTTPNGFNWVYRRFVKEPMNSSVIVFGSSSDNAENLGSNYIDDLYANYDPKLAQQELEGKFINSTDGLVCHAFNRHFNCAKTNDHDKQIWMGLDFNVNPLCGTFVYESSNSLFTTNELYLKHSNTFKAAKEIARIYPEWRIKIVPDETGNRRKTAAAETDHQILRAARFDVVNFKNPPVKDRVNNLNRLFHQQRLFVDPEKCPNLMNDLETLTHESKDDMLGHLVDSLGYVCWHLLPMSKPRREVSVHYL